MEIYNLLRLTKRQYEKLDKINLIIKEETNKIKANLSYKEILDSFTLYKQQIKQWLVDNHSNFNFVSIAKYDSDADEWIENNFDYTDTTLRFDLSDNRYDIEFMLHIIDGKLIIFKQIRHWESFDWRFEFVELLKVEV